ncbi:MAG TPA: FkbM family methyltransferase [Candidatus Binataceae bacterium]|nr:FkbM family methyltransferase [Candidatus Binataceae bacterium]
MNLRSSDFSGMREMYARGVYFVLPDFRVRPGDTVVDLGANVGLFTLLAARIGASAIAVEAQSEFLGEIQANLARNNCHATVLLGLVGAESGVVSRPGGLSGGSHYKDEPPRIELNELFALQHVKQVNFLKIDIEGSEYALFSKNTEWLSRVDKIAMEVHPGFGRLSTITESLSNHGFEFQLRNARLRPVPDLQPPASYLYAWHSRDGALHAQTPALEHSGN